jgi:hypothetical protein
MIVGNQQGSPLGPEANTSASEVDSITVDPESFALEGLAEAETAAGRLTKEAAVREGIEFARDQTLSRPNLARDERARAGTFYSSVRY